MSWRRVATALLAAGVAACDQPPCESPITPSPEPQPSGTIAVAVTRAGGTFASARAVAGERGLFEVAASDGSLHQLRIATRRRPLPHRRPLAFKRLAELLGFGELVVDTRLLRLPLADVAGLLAADADAATYVRKNAVVANDGTIAALLTAQVRGQEIGTGDVARVRRWRQLVSQPQAIGDDERLLVRSYVAALMLDYLGANVLRSSFVYQHDQRRVVLVDNRHAFASYASSAAHEIVLAMLAKVVQIPKRTLRALEAVPKAKLAAQIRRERMEDRVWGPRQLSDYEERRRTLLSLLHARIAQYGRATVLAL